MGKAGGDPIIPFAVCELDAPPGTRCILFLPGSSLPRWVAGAQREEGCLIRCPEAEADDLCRGRLAVPIPDRWQLPPPADEGEPLPAYWARAIGGHPTVAAIMELGSAVQLMPAPLWTRVCPAEVDVDWWEKHFPLNHGLEADWKGHYRRSDVLNHYLRWAVWRLKVEAFDRLRVADWRVRGRRSDDPEGPTQPVPAGLWNNHHMSLYPRDGWFRPEPQPRHPLSPPKLPSFVDLTIDAGIAAPSAPIVPPDPRPKATGPQWKLFFEACVRTWPNDQPAPTEDEDLLAATQHFAPGFSRDEFRLMRTKHTPPAWRKQGPRLPWGKAK